MKKLLMFLVVLLSIPALAATGSGSITASGQSVVVDCAGGGTAGIQISGTWVGDLDIQGTVDGTTWNYIYGRFLSGAGTYSSFTTNAHMVTQCDGVSQVRLYADAWTSGTASISWITTPGSSWPVAGSLRPSDFQSAVEGTQAEGAFASSAPVKGGGMYHASRVSYGDNAATVSQSDIHGRQRVVLEHGGKAVYSATSSLGFGTAASPSDVCVLGGSASKLVRVLKMKIACTQSSAGTVNAQLVKRSSADTGGTSSSGTAVPHDSTDSAATATFKNYTANPTLGSAIGALDGYRLFTPTTALYGGYGAEKNFGLEGKALELSGTAQQVAWNLNGVSLSSGACTCSAEWEEE